MHTIASVRVFRFVSRGPPMPLRYLFVDMNAYFASVEQQDNPALRGRPVAVVPVMARTTCCLAVSYEGKAKGVKTGTPVWEAEKLCPCCGRVRDCIGEQTSEQLDYEPAHYFVVRHIKKTYACRHCDCAGTPAQRFRTAGPAVVGPIPKGLPGPGLLAQLITSKYADHLPLFRLEKIVSRSGVAPAPKIVIW